MKKEPRVAVITGTSRGIGEFLAHHFVEHGYLVEGCSREAVHRKLKGYAHTACDIRDEEQVKSFVAAVAAKHGRIDVLINNAGVASMNHILLTPKSTVDKLMGVNFTGTFLMCRESAKVMQKRRYGRIVNMSTVAVPLRLEGECIYAASKSAVETFSRVFAGEVASLGITCNAVAPTPVETDLIRSVPKEKIAAIMKRIPLRRLGKFEDVANAIDFFVRPESEYITGQVLYLGGVS